MFKILVTFSYVCAGLVTCNSIHHEETSALVNTIEQEAPNVKSSDSENHHRAECQALVFGQLGIQEVLANLSQAFAAHVVATQDDEHKDEVIHNIQQDMIKQQMELIKLQSEMIKRQEEMMNQLETINQQQEIISQQEKTINQQQVMINQQLEVINQQEETINQQQEMINQQEETINQKQDTINQQQETINQMQETINLQQETINQKQETINQQQVTINKQRTTIQQQEANARQTTDQLQNKENRIRTLQSDKTNLQAQLQQCQRRCDTKDDSECPKNSASYITPGMTPIRVPIPGKVLPGKSIRVKGKLPAGATRFSVNLLCDDNEDQAFHFDVRIRIKEGDEKVIVRNTLTNGEWGPEERELSYFPFAEGETFTMTILCEEHSYKISVNDQKLTDYRHRITALERVDTLTILGEVDISCISFK